MEPPATMCARMSNRDEVFQSTMCARMSNKDEVFQSQARWRVEWWDRAVPRPRGVLEGWDSPWMGEVSLTAKP